MPFDAQARNTNLASNGAVRRGMTLHHRFVTRYRDIGMPHLAFTVSRSTWLAKGFMRGEGAEPPPA